MRKVRQGGEEGEKEVDALANILIAHEWRSHSELTINHEEL